MSGRSGKSSLSKLTTKQSRERLRSYLVRGARWTLVLTGIAICGYSILLLGTSSIESRMFRLEEIEYFGIQHLDKVPLNEMIRNTLPNNALKIRLERLRSLVESENWVKTAIVRRRLPNRIQIWITERKPVAVAALQNELVVVDAEGIVLAGYGPGFEFLDLPIVKGLQNTALENAQSRNITKMRIYLELIKELDSEGSNYVQTLSEIDVSDVERVAVVPTEDPVPIVLGDRNFLLRYRVFLDQIEIYHEVQKQSGDGIKSIDVTLEDRIIIKTNQSSNSSGVES